MATDRDDAPWPLEYEPSFAPEDRRVNFVSIAAGAGAVLAMSAIIFLLTADRPAETSATASFPLEAVAPSSTEVAPSTQPAAPDTSSTLASEPAAHRSEALQDELNRLVAGTPIIFEPSQTGLTELHLRILNNAAMILSAYPELTVSIVGYTDEVGDADANRRVSLARGESVRTYLVSQGVTEGSLSVEARGEDESSGSAALASLERRVEFEVTTPATAALPGQETLRIAIVAPSARNDLAFTQSMVDAVDAITEERGGVQLDVTDNTFVPEDAAAALRSYAAQGYDLVIAHGSQFGSSVLEIAPEYPDVAFAWGTASDTFGLPNVYAYDAAAEQGGYVLGALGARLTSSRVLGVVGPIEVGDAERYVNGFRAGAAAEQPGAAVLVSYTGSFSDSTLAADAAQAHVDAGADVMTGSAQMVVGAVSIASENRTLWFGTQANQTSLAPDLVVASQVYHWEVVLREIISDLDSGAPTGRTYTASLANEGLVIEYNPAFTLPDDVRGRADQLVAGIINGTVVAPR